MYWMTWITQTIAMIPPPTVKPMAGHCHPSSITIPYTCVRESEREGKEEKERVSHE